MFPSEIWTNHEDRLLLTLLTIHFALMKSDPLSVVFRIDVILGPVSKLKACDPFKCLKAMEADLLFSVDSLIQCVVTQM